MIRLLITFIMALFLVACNTKYDQVCVLMPDNTKHLIYVDDAAEYLMSGDSINTVNNNNEMVKAVVVEVRDK